MVDSNLPQGCSHLINPSNNSPEQCVWQIMYTEHYCSFNWDPSLSPIAKCQDLLLQSSNLSANAKEVLCTSRICLHRLNTHPIGVKHQSYSIAHTSHGNCSAASKKYHHNFIFRMI